MTLDFTSAGWKQALWTVVKVILIVSASAGITKAIELLSAWQPTTETWVIVQGLINIVLAGVQKWLATSEKK